MKYRVTFRERNDSSGNPSENPPDFLEPELTDGMVLDATLVERLEPGNLHGSEQMEEDDDFLSIGTEVWEYDIADGRDKDFTDALRNSEMVVDYEVVDEASSTAQP